MTTYTVSVKREILEAQKDFDSVVDRIFKAIGRTDRSTLASILSETDFVRFSERIQSATGPSGLMEFATYDLGDAVGKDGGADAYRIIRIVAGNPLIMRQMVASVPHAGSYAPITILVYEEGEKVMLAYDRMESYLQPFASEQAMEVARSLDNKVLALLADAASA
ncbi:DUF302 domain-containing protein [Rhizobium sp.]|uniref:DUF302 domain-containing protein n=1 Tax=Rhizobium sp. TaxID=391 RepID=UPI0034C63604